MTGAETWLDDDDVMLGATHFNTIDGALIIVTEVLPTDTWRLHVLLAENGATVLEQVHNKAEESVVAIVESGDTAFNNIDVGQYVIWNGDIYKAIAAISSGDTLAATGNGANLSVPAGGAVNDLNSSLSDKIRMFNGIEIQSGTDLNTITTAGNYFCSTSAVAATCTNTPVTTRGFTMQVLEKGGTVNQILCSGTGYFVRGYYNSWSDWMKLAKDSDVATLIEQTGILNIGSVTIADFQTALQTAGGSLHNGEIKNFYVSTTDASDPIIATAYVGTIRRTFTDRYEVVMQRNNGNDVVVGSYGSSGWKWDRFTVKSETDALSEQIANYTNSGVQKQIAGTDLNTLKVAGRYFYTNTCSNRPSTSDGYIDVYVFSSNYAKQIAHETVTYKSYVRYCNNGTWSSWEELAMNSGTNMARASVSIKSDTAIIDWEPGTYAINDANAYTNGYIPYQYGSIVINKPAGNLYGNCFFITTNGSKVYVRSFHKSNKTWYTGWQQLVTSSDSRSTINDGITYASDMEPTEQYSGMYTYHKTVEFVFYDNKSSPSTYTEGKLIGTISSAYRCTRGFYVPFFETTNSAVVGSVYISPTGTVKYYGQTITTKGVFHAMWMIP